MVASFRNWLGRTLARKFILLLAGFLALQAIMLVVGVIGVRHLGEEGGFINEAGRQRYRTLLIAIRAEEAFASGRPMIEVTRLRVEMDAYFTRFRKFLDADRSIEGLMFHSARHDALRAAVSQAEKNWQGELRPLVMVFENEPPPAAPRALARFKALAPEQVARLEAIVTMLEQDVRANTSGLVRFSVALLTASLALGVLGFVLMWRGATQPLRRLIDVSKEIAAGAYERRMTHGSRDELGELAAAFNQMAGAVEARTSQLSALNQVAIAITTSTSFKDTLDEIMSSAIHLTGSQAACIAFYDQGSGRFTEWEAQGLSEHFVRNMSFRPGGLADEAFTANTSADVIAYILSNDRPDTRHRLSRLAREEGITGFICLPLTSHTARLGVIYVYRKDGEDFAPAEIELLTTFARLAAEAIENRRLHERLAGEARTDALTGLLNRRVFDRRLDEEQSRAQRYVKTYTLLMIDVDHFKRINDSYGHPAGDAVLKSVAGILKKQFRDVDTVARYGGEEFAVILPEISGGTAKPVAERVRRAIETTPFRLPDGRDIGITVSIGVSCYPHCGAGAREAVERADQALYTAKEAGRNRVVLYREMLKKQIDEDPGRIVVLLNESLDNIQPIVTAISAKAPFFLGHMQAVEQATLMLASALRLSAEDIEALRLASRLHDIGMAMIFDAVLNKTARLSEDESAQVWRHPAIAADWLEQVPALARIAPIVRHHHERWDGGGYPDGLRGEATPYLARVLAVADVWSAMSTAWPGRPARSKSVVHEEIRSSSGTQLDPAIVEALLAAFGPEQAGGSPATAGRGP